LLRRLEAVVAEAKNVLEDNLPGNWRSLVVSREATSRACKRSSTAFLIPGSYARDHSYHPVAIGDGYRLAWEPQAPEEGAPP